MRHLCISGCRTRSSGWWTPDRISTAAYFDSLLAALGEPHELSQFRAGKAELDEWLREHARLAMGEGTRTDVALDDASTVTSMRCRIARIA